MAADVDPKLPPGAARCPGPSTRDIIVADGDSVPAALLEERYAFLGDADIDYERYTSPAVFAAENAKLWPKVWQWACREEHVPEPGDYITYEVGPYSFLITRTESGALKGYYNACMHRGTMLKEPGSSGSTPSIRCPFHGWTFNLDGSIQHIPCRWDFPHVTDGTHRLREVRLATWGGFVFLCMDDDAPPLETYLGVLPAHFRDGWDLSRRYVALHIQKELPTNWKAAMEAFLEAYHIVETHAQALPTAGDANAQYDVFGDTVSRFVHTIGFPSPHYTQTQTQAELFAKLRVAPPDVSLPEGEQARPYAAKLLREAMGAAWGVDLSGYSISEMMDSIEYHLFPNMCLFPGPMLPMIYRFRPIGMDHGRTLFDLMFLRPVPDGAERPLPAEPVRLRVEQSYAEAPGMDPGLGAVYDQDTNNLDLQYRGFLASHKRGQTLGNYQEVRIRHFQQMLDRYLNA
jgi:phenylpropionate dioxygenase-like ring-hydroxylating dioxygenase large terminal subunit